MPEGLARVHVRHVHLDDRQAGARDRVTQRHGRVRVGAGVEHHADEVAHRVRPPRLLQPVDEHALVVALPGLEVEPPPPRLGPAEPEDVVERRRPVDVGLARPEQVEVGPVEHEHTGRIRHGAHPGTRP